MFFHRSMDSSKELKEGIEILTAKIQKYKPKIAVFNGKGKRSIKFYLYSLTTLYLWIFCLKSGWHFLMMYDVNTFRKFIVNFQVQDNIYHHGIYEFACSENVNMVKTEKFWKFSFFSVTLPIIQTFHWWNETQCIAWKMFFTTSHYAIF